MAAGQLDKAVRRALLRSHSRLEADSQATALEIRFGLDRRRAETMRLVQH